MSERIVIDHHTCGWQPAFFSQVPEVGEEVEVASTPDAREWDEFMRALATEGRGLDYHDTVREGYDVYVVVAYTPE